MLSDYGTIYVKWDKTVRSKYLYRIKHRSLIFFIISIPVPCSIPWIQISWQETNITYSLACVFLVLNYLRKNLILYWHNTLDSNISEKENNSATLSVALAFLQKELIYYFHNTNFLNHNDAQNRQKFLSMTWMASLKKSLIQY